MLIVRSVLTLLCTFTVAAAAAAQPASHPATSISPSGTTLITLHVANAQPLAVSEALSQQAGVTVAPWPPQIWGDQAGPAVPHITLDLDSVPFWSAMTKFCAAANVRP